MAATKHREPNRARWVGVRPAHEGEQIAKSGSANNGSSIIHTVTVGKIFCLTHWIVSAYQSTAGVSSRLVVNDSVGALQYTIVLLYSAAVGGQVASGSPLVPIEIPAEWKISLISNGAGATVYGFIAGFEIDA